jgi:putative endonuclease
MRSCRRTLGRRAHALGVSAEAAACAALISDGWDVLGQRLRTPAGEIDLVAQKGGLCAIVVVKARATLTDAATAITARQRLRLLAATEILLAAHPGWGSAGVRFDLLMVDAAGTVRRIADAFRAEE